MKAMNRETRRYIQTLSKDKLVKWLSVYGMEMYDDGIRDAFMSLLLKLHDDFDFDNEKTEQLLRSCEPWMQACIKHEEDIDSEGIKKTLISEGLVCLKDTDL